MPSIVSNNIICLLQCTFPSSLDICRYAILTVYDVDHYNEAIKNIGHRSLINMACVCVCVTSLFMSSGQCGVALDRNDGRYVCNVLSGFAPNARAFRRGYRRLSCSCRLNTNNNVLLHYIL